MDENEEFEFALALEKERQGQEPITPGLFGTSVGENSELLRKARIPSDLIRQGGKILSSAMEPETQSVGLNMLGNVPGVMIEHASEGLAGQLSPEGALIQGVIKGGQLAAKPANAFGRFIGKSAGRITNLTDKNRVLLAEATENPGLMFKPGVESANEIYADKVDPKLIRDSFKTVVGKKEFVEDAIKSIQGGGITPDEALIVRQTLDSIKNQVPRSTYIYQRKILNDIAKVKFAGADEAYQTAVKAEALREPFPMNKTGGASKLLTGLQGAALGGGAIFNPLTALLAPALSPLGQATVASSIGVAKKILNSPGAANTISALIDRFRNE